MALIVRILMLMIAFVAANFLAVNILAVGKVLLDPSNLNHYAGDGFPGGRIVGYLVFILVSSMFACIALFVPACIVIAATEAFEIRNVWFYVALGGLGGFLLDVVLTKFEFVGTRSFFRGYSWDEMVLADMAGTAAGLLFWRLAGYCSGAWRSAMPLTSSRA